jgi:hypothetical protein
LQRAIRDAVKLPADLAGLHIFVDQDGYAFFVELAAVRAGERSIFDQLHLGVRIAHEEAARVGRVDHLAPVAALGRLDLFDLGSVARRCVALLGIAAGDRDDGGGAGQENGRLHRFTRSG